MQGKARVQLTVDPEVKAWANEHINNLSDMLNRHIKTQMSFTETKEQLELQKKDMEKYMQDLDNKIKILETQDQLELNKVKDEQAKVKQEEDLTNTKFDKWILDLVPLEELKTFNEDDREQYNNLYTAIKDKFGVKPLGLYEQIKRIKAELTDNIDKIDNEVTKDV
jgi:hypothetical protein